MLRAIGRLRAVMCLLAGVMATVLSSGGAPYLTSMNVLSSNDTSYTVTKSVLNSAGTSYMVV